MTICFSLLPWLWNLTGVLEPLRTHCLSGFGVEEGHVGLIHSDDGVQECITHVEVGLNVSASTAHLLFCWPQSAFLAPTLRHV